MGLKRTAVEGGQGGKWPGPVKGLPRGASRAGDVEGSPIHAGGLCFLLVMLGSPCVVIIK